MFQQQFGTTEKFSGYHCFSLFRGKSKPCDDCPLIQATQGDIKQIENLPPNQMFYDGTETIFGTEKNNHPKTYSMRIIPNRDTITNKVTSFFLILY